MPHFFAVVTLSLSLLLGGSATATSPPDEFAQGSAQQRSWPHWSWPISGPPEIVHPFLAPADRYSAGHRGIDIAGDGPIRAPAEGVVHFAGRVVDRGVLSISHDGGVISSYEPITTALHAGDLVHRGDIIGLLDAGHCATTCLHFGVRVHDDYVSPLLFLGGMRRPILLPTRALDQARG